MLVEFTLLHLTLQVRWVVALRALIVVLCAVSVSAAEDHVGSATSSLANAVFWFVILTHLFP